MPTGKRDGVSNYLLNRQIFELSVMDDRMEIWLEGSDRARRSKWVTATRQRDRDDGEVKVSRLATKNLPGRVTRR